jgi:hypothetical protein
VKGFVFCVILSNGNVGIGTTNPAAKLDVNGTISANILNLQGGTINLSGTGSIYAGAGNNYVNIIGSGSGGVQIFTNNGGGSGGNFSSVIIASASSGGTQAAYQNIYHGNNSASGTAYLQCVYDGAVIGAILQSGTTAISIYYGSDYRLKSNVKPIDTSLLYRLKPCSFTWMQDNRDDIGFIAHEFQEVFPDNVINQKDEVDENGKPKIQMMSNTVCIPLLVACVQEQQAQVTQLISQNATQQAQIDALLQRLAAAGIA